MRVIVLHLWYVDVVGIMKKVFYTCTGTRLAVGRQFRFQVTMKSIIESLGCLQRHAIHIKCLRCLLSAHPHSERSRSHRGRFLVQLFLTLLRVHCIDRSIDWDRSGCYQHSDISQGGVKKVGDIMKKGTDAFRSANPNQDVRYPGKHSWKAKKRKDEGEGWHAASDFDTE